MHTQRRGATARSRRTRIWTSTWKHRVRRARTAQRHRADRWILLSLIHTGTHALAEALVEEEHEGPPPPVWKGVAYLVAGGVGIILASEPFINDVVDIAAALHVNPVLLAFFLAPIASEAPEILESISLSRKGKLLSINIAFSNMVGGTVTKTTLLTSIFCFYGVHRSFPWEHPAYTVSLAMLAVCAASTSAMGYFIARLSLTHAYLCFALFGVAGVIQYAISRTGVEPLAALPEVAEALARTATTPALTRP